MEETKFTIAQANTKLDKNGKIIEELVSFEEFTMESSPNEFLPSPCQQQSNMDPNINPFFQEWDTAYEVPPFMDIKDEHYMPAYKKGMEENLSEIDVIVNNTDSFKLYSCEE